MARRDKGFWIGALWLLIAVLCWAGSAGALAYRDSLFDKTRVSYRGASLTVGDMEELRERAAVDGGRVAAYAQTLSQTVESEETAASASVDALWVDGDATLAWNFETVRGQLLQETDATGTALDEQTALTLFGTLDIVGKTVTIAGEELEVRGVFRLPDGLSDLAADPGRGIMLCPLGKAPSGTSATAVEFWAPQGMDTPIEELASTWINETGVRAGSLLDREDLSALLAFLTDLPAYLLAALILIELLRALMRLTRSFLARYSAIRQDRLLPLRRVVRPFAWWLLGALLLAGLCLLTIRAMPPLAPVPPSFLPTRWSDFSFWSTLFDNAMRDTARATLSVSLRPDMVYGRLTSWVAGLLIASLVLLIAARRRMKHGALSIGPLRAGICAVVACLFAPAAFFAVRLVGWVPTEVPGMLLFPFLLVLLFTGLRALNLTEKWLPWAERMRGRRFKLSLPRLRGKKRTEGSRAS